VSESVPTAEKFSSLWQ